MKTKNIIGILIVLIVMWLPAQAVFASISESITTTQSPTTWTKGNVTLTVSKAGASSILLPNGTKVTTNTVNYVATENNAYSFIGFNSNDEVVAIKTHVVDNIDRVGKDITTEPNDTNWRKEDVQVKVNPVPSNAR